ncbi:hypothetical protein CKO31_21815 [Thiohalocapsa halophila]|uniref:Oligosaccharide repeat unit polymerase n=1 Tax=Thiohalocapsa halophila TaxID=69359 RepID=A0ABS1CN66_9GAMM|nr:hypothetical protein [Thiohalocapsa halophila]MBK1633340.1 hypothetical protein [Thiohalocapsa halophila]
MAWFKNLRVDEALGPTTGTGRVAVSKVLLGILVAECLLILWWGLQQRSRMIQYPFLVAAVFLGWMVPQLLGLTQNPYLPPGALPKTILMAILCLGAVYLGYTINPRPARLFWWRFDEHRLLVGSVVMSLLGAFFFFQVSRLAASVTAVHSGAWTGPITIYVFFSQLLTIGLVIAIILHLSKPRWQTLLIIVFDLSFYLDRIVIHGRRDAMVELGLIILMAFWFHRRWLPSRWFIIAGLVGGSLFINSIGDYRATMLAEDRSSWSGAGLQEILSIDFVGNLNKIIEGEAASADLYNAAMDIEAADRLAVFDFWLTLWNQVVGSFVPGQWVGHDVKNSLMLDLGVKGYEHFGYAQQRGSTSTGLSDAFRSFWFFGAIKFFLAALIMSRWYQAGVNGNIVAQMILMLIISDSLHLVTHSSTRFYMGFIELAAFLLPLLLFARSKPIRARLMRGRIGKRRALVSGLG